MKVLRSFVLAALSAIVCVCTAGCRNEREWFSEKELKKVHLQGLSAPTFMTDEIETLVDEESFLIGFTQPIENGGEKTKAYGQEVLEYLADEYGNGRYGVAEYVGAVTEEESYYKIVTQTDIEAYNTSPLEDSLFYKIYYITAEDYEENGFYPDDGVFEIRIAYRAYNSEMAMQVSYACGVSKLFKYK